MKQFTYTGTLLKEVNPETGELVIMRNGDTLSLPDEMVEKMCSHGWGTAEGVETGERKAGVANAAPVKSASSILPKQPVVEITSVETTSVETATVETN